MIVFDIETTGLCVEHDEITVVACVDSVTKAFFGFEFGRMLDEGDAMAYDDARQGLIKLFDSADSLAAFNGVCFDIQFIVARFKIGQARAMRWVLKCVDLFEMMRVRTNRYYSLNTIATSNAVATKTSNGKQAVVMANRKQWKELLEYCVHDVYITDQLYTLPKIKVGFGFVNPVTLMNKDD
jgi:DNA polymerase III epsilon subunit-like protein